VPRQVPCTKGAHVLAGLRRFAIPMAVHVSTHRGLVAAGQKEKELHHQRNRQRSNDGDH
jgi:hypothetical protein